MSMFEDEDDNEEDDELKKIPYQEYLVFCNEYHMLSKYKALRFGQAFINKFYPNVLGERLDPMLYEAPLSIAMKIIYNTYIDFGEE